MMQKNHSIRQKTMKVRLFILIFSLGLATHAGAMDIGDPTSLPNAGSFGFGASLDYADKELDIDSNQDFIKIIGRLNYSLTDKLGIYLKGGLFQTESIAGKDTDWGLGVGLGIQGYFLTFRDDTIRIGYDVQVFRSQVDNLYQNRLGRFNYDQEVTVTEYQVSGIVSWRAYTPVHLYTGVQFSKTDIDFDTIFYPWDDSDSYGETIDSEEDSPFILLWGVTYQFAKQVQMYGEFRAGNEMGAMVGFHFAF